MTMPIMPKIFLSSPLQKGKGREGTTGVRKMEVCCMHTYEDSIMKPIKHCLKERGRRRVRMGI
jgi:hypothetical protein